MDVEQRVTRLEADMAQMQEEWAVVQQAPLIQARLLNALRATQLEHSQAIAGLNQRLGGVEQRLGGVEHKLGGIELRLSGLESVVAGHSGKLDQHSVKLDEHSAKLDEHSVKLDEHSVKLDLLAQGQEVIVGMLTTLIDREPGTHGLSSD